MFELKDVAEQFSELPYAFHGATLPLTHADVEARILRAGVPAATVEQARNLMVWFGFLGYWIPPDGERFSNQYQHDLRKMRSGLPEGHAYTIHPAFRTALETINRYDSS